MDKKLWLELLEAWLKSMGCESVWDHRFYYKEQRYYYGIEDHIVFIVLVTKYRPRTYIGVDVTKDPHDPSFDPDRFFRPFKRWIGKHSWWHLLRCLVPLWKFKS